MFPKNLTFSMADGINNFVDWLVMRYGDSLRHVSDSILSLIVGLEGLLRAIPWWAFLILAGALAWHASKRWTQVVVVVALLYFVGAVGLWDKLMQTLALMMVATLLSVAVGIPLGILSAGNDRFRTVLLPMLDAEKSETTCITCPRASSPC